MAEAFEAQKKQTTGNTWGGVFVERALRDAAQDASANATKILAMTASTFGKDAPDFNKLEVAQLIKRMQRGDFEGKMTVKFGEQIV